MQSENIIRRTKQLVSFDSTSCYTNVPAANWLKTELEFLRFDVEEIFYEDRLGIEKLNLVAKRGVGQGGLAYFAHSDVVPSDSWSLNSSPFEVIEKDDRLYGRGTCDMKGSIAAMLTAIETIALSDQIAPVYFVCTGDEEVGFWGAKEVVARSRIYREIRQNEAKAIIGEPTSLEVVHGHKGVCGLHITSHGRSAHSSCLEGINSNLQMIPFLFEMKKLHDRLHTDPQWHHDEFDPPTVAFNIGVNDFTHAYNITPGKTLCTIGFRPMPGQDAKLIIDQIRNHAEDLKLDFSIHSFGQPFRTDPQGSYVQRCLKLTDTARSKTVAFGTDGCEFCDLKDMVVLGPGNIEQAHTNDEWVSIDQLMNGTNIYARMIRTFCCE